MQILKATSSDSDRPNNKRNRLRQLGSCARCMSGITGWQKPNAFWMLAKNCLLPLS